MYTDPPEVGKLKNGEVASDGQSETPEIFHHNSLPRSGKPIPKLASRRWWGEILEPGEEADLIRRAQAGDKAALSTLLKKFHRFVLKIAKKYVQDPQIERQAQAWELTTHDGPELDDLVAEGMAELTKAITRVDLRRNNGLCAYAQKYVKGAISAEVRNWKKRGTFGETRIERWVYSRPYDTPQQIADALIKRGIRCTPEQAEQAQHSVTARRSTEHYSTTDSDYNEDDNFIGARPATSHEMYRMYDCYNSSAYVRFHNAISGCMDRWAVEAERREAKRLKAIGRRAYALELVARDHARIAARADPQQYLYPWKRATAATTHPQRKRKSRPRQPRKRYWRSWEYHAAA